MEPQDPTRELVERAQVGDRWALETLFCEHRPRVAALIESRLRRRGSGAPAPEVDDVLQEACTRATAALAAFAWRTDDAFFRWLSGIALNVLRESESRLARQKTVTLDHDPAAAGSSPSRAMRREERCERLEQALASLGAEQREALLLVRVEGLSVREVAERTGRTPQAVSCLLLRASRKLRELFGETESLHLPDRRLRLGGGAEGGGDGAR